ncbi:heparinase II/III family protein [Hyphomonas johnsonii]|uniref:Heparinase II/III-like family protein n=1 Tax=Hyphomonas johnsonii MHS-2 TaxID=1280950 RepID=A0A059FM54_9PROT|nr:heparinase II/III family protein [Hyphomonas johnsonii]KCZ91692.1 heparinase II/III-like family protein [Hyphomonas johnsonii MHS-2]
MGGGDSEFQADRRRSVADDAAIWRRFRGVGGEDARIGALQRLKLAGAVPSGFSVRLPDIIPPDTWRGEALMRDTWRIGMERLTLPKGAAPWTAALPSRHYADRLHRFDWLPDLISQGEAGEQRAVEFVDSWIEAFGAFDGFAWRAEPTAYRLWNWMRCSDVLFPNGGGSERDARMENLVRQLRYLADALEHTSDPKTRWMGSCVLVARAICLDGGQKLDEALARLDGECTAQILPDGGHVSRSPARLLSALLNLLTLQEVLQQAGHVVPEFFGKWVSRMGAMLAFFQTEDGALNTFNDGDEARPETVEAALSRLSAPPRRFTFAPKSGFQKLQKGALRLVLDCGEAPLPPFGDFAHAGALGFELSDGPARIVTSCGYSAEVNVDWQAAVRRTGAHSTLVLAGRDSSSFVMNDESRVLAASGPEGISAKRLEESDEIWLDAQHSGYKAPCGLLHRRRLFMSGDGARLTGEDSLVRPISQPPSDDNKFINFEIRFHLHPTVTAMMSRDAIRLICDNGTVWRFKTSHEGTRLERTVYLARGIVEQPEQIVMAGYADPNGDGNEPPNCVRWAFLREAAA